MADKEIAEVNAILDIGASQATQRIATSWNGDEGGPYVLTPPGYNVATLEHLLVQPTRAKGNTKLGDADSFIRFVGENTLGACTRLYGRTDPPSFKAVFNDTIAGGGAGWADHTATYDCPLSREWKLWNASNGAAKAMGQEAFAKFIEDNALDIRAFPADPDKPDDEATPSAADMLDVALLFEAKKRVNFSSGIRLDNGQQQVTYEETIEGTTRKGQLKMPQTFAIAIPVMEGAAPYRVDARLRYRIGDTGSLVLWYDLIRPHKSLEDAATEVWIQIEEGTGLKIFKTAA